MNIFGTGSSGFGLLGRHKAILIVPTLFLPIWLIASLRLISLLPPIWLPALTSLKVDASGIFDLWCYGLVPLVLFAPWNVLLHVAVLRSPMGGQTFLTEPFEMTLKKQALLTIPIWIQGMIIATAIFMVIPIATSIVESYLPVRTASYLTAVKNVGDMDHFGRAMDELINLIEEKRILKSGAAAEDDMFEHGKGRFGAVLRFVSFIVILIYFLPLLIVFAIATIPVLWIYRTVRIRAWRNAHFTLTDFSLPTSKGAIKIYLLSLVLSGITVSAVYFLLSLPLYYFFSSYYPSDDLKDLFSGISHGEIAAIFIWIAAIGLMSLCANLGALLVIAPQVSVARYQMSR